MIVIKKYENRRLYDTASSRYVNLEDVAALVREGEEVQVIDAKSGEDLTRVVLTQIIVEGAKDKDSGLPIDMLRQIIIASGRAQQQILTSYFRFALDLYLRAHQDLRERISGARTKSLGPLEAVQKFFGSAATMGNLPWAMSRNTAKSAAPEATSELGELRARLDALERQLAQSRTD
jgi:polyhydroxyalkanoate synthesis repressor PhaR